VQECQGCGYELNSKRKWCEICEIVVPRIIGRDTKTVKDERAIESVRAELGNPDTAPARIWGRIRDLDGSEVDWAYDREPVEGSLRTLLPAPAWEIDVEDIESIQSGFKPTEDPERLRRLHRGGYLPDGSLLSWSADKWYLDGIPIAVPYLGLRKLLRRKRGMEKINWKRLLLSLSLASEAVTPPWKEGVNGVVEVIHPVAAVSRQGAEDAEGGGLRLALMRFFSYRRRIPSLLTGFNSDWFEDAGWLRSWDSIDSTQDMWDDITVPRTLRIHKGRLQLRVRRNRGWKWLEVGSNPLVWTRIASWALSAPSHPNYNRLMCLQQSLFADRDHRLISEPDKEAIGLLSGVAQNPNVTVNTDKAAFDITGTTGTMYRVIPGHAAHARFTVYGMGHETSPRRERRAARGRLPDLGRMERYERERRHHICIIESWQLRRLALADALVQIVSTLLDDKRTQRRITTLSGYIRAVGPRNTDPEVLAVNQAAELRHRLRNNAVEARVRRYTESLPRLWGVLLRRPLADRLLFTAREHDRPNIRFDECDTAFMTRGHLERRVIYRMLEASGWQRDHREEARRGVQRVYIRLGTGGRELGNQVEEFAEMLEPEMAVNERVRLIADRLWTFYERRNPGTGELLPGTDQRLD